jgi:hypothetical protein
MKISEYNIDKRLWMWLALLIYLPWWFFGRVNINEIEIAPATWLCQFFGRLFHSHTCIPGAASEASILILIACLFSLPAIFLGWLLQCAIVMIKTKTTATAPEPAAGVPFFARLGLILFVFTLSFTGLSWLFLGAHSPMPCTRLKLFWAYADFPAQLLFSKTFGYRGSENEFFFFVFLQWLLVGAAIGAYITASRKKATTA